MTSTTVGCWPISINQLLWADHQLSLIRVPTPLDGIEEVH